MLACLTAPAAAIADYEVEIHKRERVLVVRNGDEVVRVFRVAVGRGGGGDKQQTGDNRTPVGTYRVVGQNRSNRFEHFIRLNYPNVKDAFYGLRNAIITRREFDRILAALRAGRLPPQNTALGGAIGIHGIGEETPEKVHIHANLDWTEGCIALRNAEVHELRPFLGVGTRVVIRE
ncbi:MAG: L,D-transpeptidase family protein [Gammaproteobacteria bacterium]